MEPYVVAADVYTAEGHLGRGGWTWYTGSASWMYRVGLEAILGFAKRGDTLFIEPRVPAAWPEFTIEYRYRSARYRILVQRAKPGEPERGLVLDGVALRADGIPLVDDGVRALGAGRHSRSPSVPRLSRVRPVPSAPTT